jgi:hypothetical protein
LRTVPGGFSLLRFEARDLAGFAQHLVDFAEMHFLFSDLVC